MNLMEKKNYDLTEITRLLLEMRDNCVPKDGNLYDDPKRKEKYEALKAAIDLINNPSLLVTSDTENVVRSKWNERAYLDEENYERMRNQLNSLAKAMSEKGEV